MERAGAAGNPGACAGMRRAGAHRAGNSALGQLRARRCACACGRRQRRRGGCARLCPRVRARGVSVGWVGGGGWECVWRGCLCGMCLRGRGSGACFCAEGARCVSAGGDLWVSLSGGSFGGGCFCVAWGCTCGEGVCVVSVGESRGGRGAGEGGEGVPACATSM